MLGLTRRLDRSLASLCAEKRIFLQTETATTYVRLTPVRQLGLLAGAATLGGWLAISTAALVVDRVDGRAEVRPAGVLADGLEGRLAALTAERDQRADEAYSAQNRFRLAMDRIGQQQTEILRAVEQERELVAALDVMRQRLNDVAAQRDVAREETVALRGQVEEVTDSLTANAANDLGARYRPRGARRAVRLRRRA
jgi:hypothetical protein